jgi:diguanylate cyclase (GGDEF)-like protein
MHPAHGLDATLLAQLVATQHAIATGGSDLQSVLDTVVESAQSLLGATGAAIEFVEADELVYVAASGTADPYIGCRLGVASSLSGTCVRLSQIMSCPDTEADPRVDHRATRSIRASSMVIVPLRHDQRTIGVLKVLSDRVAAFDEAHVLMLELLAGLIGTAVGRAEQLGQLVLAAETDSLTGLPNRRSWDERLATGVGYAGSTGTPLAVAILDLDCFKPFNDERGHQAGDRLLVAAGAGWAARLRRGDTVARYGGDEFGILLPGATLEDALAVLHRVRRATPLGQTCSIGVAAWDGAESGAELVSRADAALYVAKTSGRDRVTACSSQRR